MSIAEELSRLDELRTRGVLSEDEFQRAKQRLLDGVGAPPAVAPAALAINRFRRSNADRWIGGVCGGLGVVSSIESWIWRLILVALALFGGTGVLLYILLWIFVPNE